MTDLKPKSVTIEYVGLSDLGEPMPKSMTLTGNKVGYSLCQFVEPPQTFGKSVPVQVDNTVSIYADKETFMVPGDRMITVYVNL